MTASPAQLHDLGENLEGLLLVGVVDLGESDQRLLAQGLVQGRLLRSQLHPAQNLGARRQRLQDLGFQPAQDKRLDQLLEPVSGRVIPIALDRHGEALVEPLQRAEQARVDEAKQVPQFAQMILDRGAGGEHFEVAAQAHGRLRALGGHVFDGLRLVEHDGPPFPARQQLRLLLQQPVAANQQIERPQLGQGPRAVAGAKHDRVQRGGETPDLIQPVQAHRGGRHHQGRTVCGAGQQQGQGLHRLAQAHVIGQAGAHAPMRQSRQPLKAVRLVIPQFGL